MTSNELDKSRKEENTHAVIAAACFAIDQASVSHPGTSKIRLHLKKTVSAVVQFYICAPGEDQNLSAILSLNNRSMLQTELASRHLQFQQSPDGLSIYSYQSTSKGCEGYGLGTGLMGATDRAIYRVLSVYSELCAGQSVIAYIIDNADGQARGVSRDGWTSYCAVALGYIPLGGNDVTFFKKYQ
ncbi:MAG TPA: hypothetical protein VJ246_00280 [Patescibacteria group bacterium]|nr:hypothetical protein [Patescibacteria group bacterium]